MSYKCYYMNKVKFYDLYNMAQEIHGNISIIKNFCSDFKDIDDFYKIIPLLKNTEKLSDKLY